MLEGSYAFKNGVQLGLSIICALEVTESWVVNPCDLTSPVMITVGVRYF